ncbi:PQQ-binding-like beta-propeller repeat protein [Olivibacter sp. CPCC 100613]|uniref:outer membrane protein assembly factor BamB family protein n=1 Tax=Olivibacter sp. CPCC 100613 TaxID=3079931 RepID=UPI002FF7A154
MKIPKAPILFFTLISVLMVILLLQGCAENCSNKAEWTSYLGGQDRNHYSSLRQIDSSNVNILHQAWVYHTRDSGEMQCNPLMIDGKLYGITAANHLFAIDAATGKEIWTNRELSEAPQVNRGIAYWSNGNEGRLLFTAQSFLYAVDIKTGKCIPSFGTAGRVSLRSGLNQRATDKFVVSTTPGTIFQDLIIMPIRVGEGVLAAPGYIQAFNVVTGKLAWVFRTIPYPGELGYETWPKEAYKNPSIGGANNWAGMALDEKRGIVYVPTGSAAFDFYGGNRKGQNLFANSLLALDAKTGKYIWHFQAVHHDVWDRDFPAPPNLTTITRNGRKIEVVAQVSKSGHIFVLDRENGQPIFPMDEVPVPTGGVPGEELWKTQPVPRLPLPFSRQTLTESDITGLSNKRDSLVDIFKKSNKGNFHPLGFTPTILFPGADGGAEWGGAAVDKQGVLYVNSNEMAWLFSLSSIKNKQQSSKPISSGRSLYLSNCVACHKADLSGNPQSGYPALTGLKQKMSRDSINNLIAFGRGMMPGLTHISEKERQSIMNYLFGEEKEEAVDKQEENVADVPYVFNGYNKFLDEQGYPAITPPWGTLTAVNLNTGKHLWQIPLGELKELSARGIPITGTENYGGPVVTAGGLLFIAATKDSKIRAFAKASGKLLWEHDLPASGFATPVTYEVDGKQFVVIACGGTKLGTSRGDSYVAFALP